MKICNKATEYILSGFTNLRVIDYNNKLIKIDQKKGIASNFLLNL